MFLTIKSLNTDKTCYITSFLNWGITGSEITQDSSKVKALTYKTVHTHLTEHTQEVPQQLQEVMSTYREIHSR